MIQADGRHRADDKELTLREIDYPGRVVNDIEADGNYRVNTADGYPGKTILNDLRKIHWRSALSVILYQGDIVIARPAFGGFRQ
jgi:hypothetical protein